MDGAAGPDSAPTPESRERLLALVRSYRLAQGENPIGPTEAPGKVMGRGL